ncbi:TipAS antibiotic-recognition domain-containing protein [Bifidobacterium sp. ESL0775]|uniref:MerR family transcriptional regulator n=1 Tax=Bifidobacterium sp. ESL0775 TaxID=2983230 RepID=UPI0023F99742|nr:TipAS antibiotic-recognition domain-containing protein [Bifidobacterium sp. ESL0775]WEV68691.1 TipAS antibiotic-recognition domain-containing protein [Bifidobacterium sp. ESL0775]
MHGTSASDGSWTPAERFGLTIGEMSTMFHVSVRMLRHWEDLGLLTPARDASGYRVYGPGDLNRLRRLLIYKELGVPATRIGRLLDAPAPVVIKELKVGRSNLKKKLRHLQRTLDDTDRLIDMAEKGTTMANTETTDSRQNEAKDRWGDTKQWMEFAERETGTDGNTKMKDEQHMRDVEAKLADAKRRGVKPGSDEANELAEEHRASLYYYEVSLPMQVSLGRMYVADKRFKKHYDDIEPGLAQWLHDIIDANAAAQGIDLDNVQWE